jgi:hypothetical protein
LEHSGEILYPVLRQIAVVITPLFLNRYLYAHPSNIDSISQPVVIDIILKHTIKP